MNLLDNLNYPDDLKKLSIDELDELSKEIRFFLLDNISKTGGHLASNLGVVELSVALLYFFDLPNDKIIWDVGHQSYVHKILTGRKNQFDTLRMYKGLSGFPKGSESIYDSFGTGHSSTSISAGFGLASSRDIQNQSFDVVSVIGDGALTGGLAYEALNNAGRSKTNMLVILNDNQMSISKNVGGITKHLNDIRSKPYYLTTKRDINSFLNKIPLVGKSLSKTIEKLKNAVKYIFVQGVLFEELGFKYIGPIDGHNIKGMLGAFEEVKNIKGPVFLHIHTKKGKGYEYAENYPEKFHGISSFDLDTGDNIKRSINETYSKVFGEKVTALAEQNEKVVAVTAAMPEGTGLDLFAKKFPNRFFDVGIAEMHAITFSAGLAKNGQIPFVPIYSTFLQRAYDNIIHDICIQKLHVIIGVDRAGLVGEDGETHQGIFDISFLSHIPNMTMLAPKNKLELEQMMDFALTYKAPIAIRYPRGKVSTCCQDIVNEISLGKSETIITGEDCAIISVGDMFDICYNVVRRLEGENIKPTLINARFIKPLDKEIIKSLTKYKYIFIAENNLKSGGYYNNVLEYMSSKDLLENIKLKSFSFDDKFIEHGSVAELFAANGLDEDSIYKTIINTLNKRKL